MALHLGAKVGPLPLWGWGAGAAALATPFLLKGKKGKGGKGGGREGGRGGHGGHGHGADMGYLAGEPMGGFNPYADPYAFGGGGYPGIGGLGLFPGFGGLFERGYGGRGFGERGYGRTGYHDPHNVWGGGGIGMFHQGPSNMEGRGILSGLHGTGSLFRGPMPYSASAFQGARADAYGSTLGAYNQSPMAEGQTQLSTEFPGGAQASVTRSYGGGQVTRR
jgi:hypothetical protein